jgi:hypothetical protein
MPDYWRGEAKASIEWLMILRTHLDAEHDNVRLEWRLYDTPPKIRGLAIDSDEMWVGYYVWDTVGQLVQQSARLLHIRDGGSGFRHYWEFFNGWFEHEWEWAPREMEIETTQKDCIG